MERRSRSGGWGGVLPLIVTFLTLWTFLAQGAENIVIPTDGLKVYSRSDIASPVIGILRRGAVVPAANQPVGNFRKVMIVVSGQKKIGFINLYDLHGPVRTVPFSALPPTTQRAVRQIRPPPSQGLHGRSFVALLGGFDYESQDPRVYTDSSGAPINVGSLTGMMTEVGIQYGFPVSHDFTLVPYLIYKPVSVTGSAAPQGANTAPSTIVLQQSFLSLGILAKKYFSSNGNFWWGGGVQNDFGVSGSLQIGSGTAIAQGSLPDFILLYGALGYDFEITKKFYLLTDIRIGAIVNTTPAILEGDFNLGVAYRF